MKRLFARLATVLAAAPLLMGTVAGSAHAGDTTIPGCYGAGVVVCNLTISIGAPIGVGTYQTTIPVCAGTCRDVPVTLVGTTPGEPARACYRYSDYYGNVSSYCAVGGGGGGGGVVEYVQETIDNLNLEDLYYEIQDAVARLEDRIRDLLGDVDVCLLLSRAVAPLGMEVQCI